MNISDIYKKITLISPRIEVIMRRLYWNNVSRLKKYSPRKEIVNKENIRNTKIFDFRKVLNYLKEQGIGEGSLLIVHSSYGGLSHTGLSEESIVEELLELVGNTGTLAMPVFRKFKQYYNDNPVLTYDVKRSRITTGILPYVLMHHRESVTSRFPLNPLTAVGPLAKGMMQHNLDGEFPSPHGPNSSWKFCLDHNAIVIGLGVQLARFNTITHVAEEAFPEWAIKDWYRKRIFNIKDGDFLLKNKVVFDRLPKWGMFHYAENNLTKNILEHNILKEKIVKNVLVGMIEAQTYISYLRSKNRKGYPYFGFCI